MWTLSHRLRNGTNCRPWLLTSTRVRRWRDLQLYPTQPVPELPAPVPASLSGWLARERHSCSDALRPCLRAGLGRLLPAGRRCSSAPSRVGDLSKPAAALFRTRHLGLDAPARDCIARTVLSRG